MKPWLVALLATATSRQGESRRGGFGGGEGGFNGSVELSGFVEQPGRISTALFPNDEQFPFSVHRHVFWRMMNEG